MGAAVLERLFRSKARSRRFAHGACGRHAGALQRFAGEFRVAAVHDRSCRGVRQAGRRSLHRIGSSAEYDPDERRCVEDKTPIRPATTYGKRKAASWLAGQRSRMDFRRPGAACPCLTDRATRRGVSSRRRSPRSVPANRFRLRTASSSAISSVPRTPPTFWSGCCRRIRPAPSTSAPAAPRPSAQSSSIWRQVAAGRICRRGAIALAPGEPAVLVADMSNVRERLSWSP